MEKLTGVLDNNERYVEFRGQWTRMEIFGNGIQRRVVSRCESLFLNDMNGQGRSNRTESTQLSNGHFQTVDFAR